MLLYKVYKTKIQEEAPNKLGAMSEIVQAAPEKEVDTSLLVTGKNPRGIPEVVFIVSTRTEDVQLSIWRIAYVPFWLDAAIYRY